MYYVVLLMRMFFFSFSRPRVVFADVLSNRQHVDHSPNRKKYFIILMKPLVVERYSTAAQDALEAAVKSLPLSAAHSRAARAASGVACRRSRRIGFRAARRFCHANAANVSAAVSRSEGRCSVRSPEPTTPGAWLLIRDSH